MLLMIDNYDSFTFNLVQYFGELGEEVRVYRNDEITVEKCITLNPRNVVISPGPGRPDEAGHRDCSLRASDRRDHRSREPVRRVVL